MQWAQPLPNSASPRTAPREDVNAAQQARRRALHAARRGDPHDRRFGVLRDRALPRRVLEPDGRDPRRLAVAARGAPRFGAATRLAHPRQSEGRHARAAPVLGAGAAEPLAGAKPQREPGGCARARTAEGHGPDHGAAVQHARLARPLDLLPRQDRATRRAEARPSVAGLWHLRGDAATRRRIARAVLVLATAKGRHRSRRLCARRGLRAEAARRRVSDRDGEGAAARRRATATGLRQLGAGDCARSKRAGRCARRRQDRQRRAELRRVMALDRRRPIEGALAPRRVCARCRSDDERAVARGACAQRPGDLGVVQEERSHARHADAHPRHARGAANDRGGAQPGGHPGVDGSVDPSPRCRRQDDPRMAAAGAEGPARVFARSARVVLPPLQLRDPSRQADVDAAVRRGNARPIRVRHRTRHARDHRVGVWRLGVDDRRDLARRASREAAF